MQIKTPRFFLGLAIILTVSCKEKSKVEVDENLRIETFSTVYDTLDILKIPITLTPDSWSEMYRAHLEKYGVKEGWELLKHPFALLSQSPNYKAVIFVSTDETGSPTLITLDRNAKPIDTLFLLGDWGNNDPSFGTSEVVTINKDFTINLIDSVFTFQLGENGDRLENSSTLKVTNELFKILYDGRIVKSR
ncbi:MAG: hypothetical protein J0L67_15200 [Cytophagales bacterium]|nr:hypothetical protein [Cytophagales bacterium]